MNEYKSDTPYTEIAIAMEDFSYNGYGYFSIPTLTPFGDNENKVSMIYLRNDGNYGYFKYIE